MPLDLVSPITADFSAIGAQAGTTDWSISGQWASRGPDERYTSINEMLDMMDRRTRVSEEITLKLGDIMPRLTDAGDLGFCLDGGTALTPTNYSFQQLGQYLSVPVGFLNNTLADAPDLIVKILEYGHRKIENPEREVMLYRSGSNLRAVTGPKYGRVLDSEIVRAVKEACDESGAIWEVPTAFAMPGATHFECVDPTKDQTTLYASDRDFCLFLVDQRNPIQAGFVTDPKTGERVPDLYSRGIIVRNGECGGVALSITTFLYRWVCFNRSIREQKGFQKVSIPHRANVREAFLKLVPAFRAFVNGSAIGVADELDRAKNARFVSNDAECMQRLTHTKTGFGFSQELATTIMGRSLLEDGRPIRTAFDMVQAMTAAARDIVNQDARMEIEKAAGRILEKV